MLSFTKSTRYFSVKYNFLILADLPCVQDLQFEQRWTINEKHTDQIS